MKRLQRLSILGSMTALLLGLLAVVLFASPYAPVVEPVKDIEEIWAIEDARMESEAPLVTVLENRGQALGYDAGSNTFYCTLGMDNTDAWPDIHLTAPGAKDVRLCFVDDYSYDWCADAIRDGYEYQIMAYTDTEFFYSYIVFTGLPIVCLNTDEMIVADADTPVGLTISAAEDGAISTYARAHKRGATTLRMRPKHGLKVEFTRHSDGTKKTSQPMPLLGETDEFILISGAMDQLLIRDKLGWDLFQGIASPEEAFGTRETAYCEVFVGDEYQGVFVMMRPYDYEQELRKLGANAAAQDCIYRLYRLAVEEDSGRVKLRTQDHRGIFYERRHAPVGCDDHAAIAPYLEMFALKDDAAFAERAVQLLDMDSVIRYALFVQACGMTDNEQNNLYITAHRQKEGYRYLYGLWDLDVSWGKDDGENAEVWYPFEIFDRLLSLDAGGIARQRTAAIWKQMRETVFNGAYLEQLLAKYDEQLNNSGAFYRDAVCWERGNAYLETYNIYSYATARWDMMDRRIEEIASEMLAGHRLRIQGYTTFDEGLLEE